MNIFGAVKSAANVLKSGAVTKGAKILFKAKKYAPQIMVVGGTVGTVAAGVWAVKKSIDEAPEAMEEIHANIMAVKHNDLGMGAMTKAYGHAAWKITKVYFGPIVLEILSVGSILYGFKIINGRFVAMSATAAALEEINRRQAIDHDNYRKALADKYGEEFDKDLKWEGEGFAVNGIPPKDENGEEGKWKIDDIVSGYDTISPYAVIFDETSTEWSTDPEYNKMTLLRIQQTCNDMLHARGHLFLNDVYKELGLPETRVGQMVGWIDNSSPAEGDGYVDFNIYNVNAVNNRSEFINGYEASVLLDFNVDGVIWDKI